MASTTADMIGIARSLRPANLLRTGTARGIERGLRGDGIWLAIGLISAGFRVIGHLRRKNQVVYRAVLAPGQRIEIDHFTNSFKELGTKPVG